MTYSTPNRSAGRTEPVLMGQLKHEALTHASGRWAGAVARQSTGGIGIGFASLGGLSATQAEPRLARWRRACPELAIA
jgi:hypothetical protein